MQRAVLFFVGSSAVALVLYAVGLMQMRKSQAVEGLHGTAHWAERHRRTHAKNIVMKFDPTAESGSVAYNPLL